MGFNINNMLMDTALWLAIQAQEPISKFIPIAQKIELRESDYTLFFKQLREDRGTFGLNELSYNFKEQNND